MGILRNFYLYVMQDVKLIECPRDAMQGIKEWIPTEKKVQYIQALLRCGFDTIDFGSFVSPKAIPQMQDTAEVLQALDLSQTESKLLAIVANLRGPKMLLRFPKLIIWGTLFQFQKTFRCGIPIKPLHSLFKFSRKYWPWPKVAKKR